MRELKTFHCGYCAEDFKQEVRVDVTLKTPLRDSIICPRCKNFIQKRTCKN